MSRRFFSADRVENRGGQAPEQTDQVETAARERRRGRERQKRDREATRGAAPVAGVSQREDGASARDERAERRRSRLEKPPSRKEEKMRFGREKKWTERLRASERKKGRKEERGMKMEGSKRNLLLSRMAKGGLFVCNKEQWTKHAAVEQRERRFLFSVCLKRVYSF